MLSMIRISSILSCIVLFTACNATPNIRLNVSGLEMELTHPVPIPASADLSPDGAYLAIGGWKESGFTLWDMSRGAQAGRFFTEKISLNSPISVVFSSDGKYILSGGKELKLWDVSSGKTVRTIGDHGASKISSFSSTGKRIATEATVQKSIWTGFYQEFQLWDTATWNTLSRFTIRPPDLVAKAEGPTFAELGFSTVMALSPDGNYILTGHMPLGLGGQLKKKAKMILWDAATGEILRDMIASEGFPVMVPSVAFSPDGKQALSGGSDGTVRIWGMPAGNELKRLQAHKGSGGTYFVAFSRDGKYFFSGGADGLLKIWDASSATEVKVFSALCGNTPGMIAQTVGYAALMPDGRSIISGSTDGAIRVWNVATGAEIAMMVGFEDGEWLVVTSEGYYNSSEKGAQYLKAKFAGKDYTVDQFYDVFYRPDIVAAKLRGENIKDLITITMQDAIKTPPPTVEIKPLVETGTSAKVCYQVKSTGGGIGEVRLFHNGKLIQSDGYYRDMAKSSSEQQILAMNSQAIYENMRGISLKSKEGIAPAASRPKGVSFEDCKEIEAVSGENEVSISAFNSTNTVQSALKTVKFDSTLKPEEPHLYIFSIGINKYKDNTVSLKYAAKDATDIEDKLLKQSATVYKPQNIHLELLTDDQAGKGNIINKIDELSQKIKPNDGFILFVAGHGVLLQSQYYMLTHDYNGSVSDSSMISSNEIVEMSKKIKSLSQLFIFDTCHAGGVDTIVSGLYDARMSVLAKKMGLHVYASANSIQEAQDGYQGNGLFTYTLLDGLNNKKKADKNNDNTISIVELGDYAQQTTMEISKKTGHSQTPLIINFGKDNPVYNLR